MRPAPRKDGLVIVSNGKNGNDVFTALGIQVLPQGQTFEDGVLHAVGILKLIHEDETQSGPHFVQNLCPVEQPAGQYQDVIEVNEGVVAQSGQVLGKEGIFSGQCVHILEFAQPLLGKVQQDVAGVLLCDVGAQALEQPDLRVFVGNAEMPGEVKVRVVLPQQANAEAVEGANRQPSGFVGEQPAQPIAHFLGRLVGVGHGEDVVRRHPQRPDDMDDTVRQRPGLARSGTGNDQV